MFYELMHHWHLKPDTCHVLKIEFWRHDRGTCTHQEHEGRRMFVSGKACHQGAGRFGRVCQAFRISVLALLVFIS